MTVLYKTGQLYTDGKFAKDQAIVVEGGLIKAIGPTKALQEKYRGIEEIDWHDKALVPGTINAHNHSFQSLLRGIAVDRPFLEWRDEALYKYTPLLDEEAIYTGALFAFGEMLKYGATTVSDFFYVHNNGTKTDEAVIQAANDLGIRLVMARTMYDWDGAPINYRESIEDATKRTRDLAIKYQGNAMVDIHPAPHSPHAASPEMIQAGHRLAKELGTPFHIHVSEEMFEVEETLEKYGKRPVHYLDSLGVVDDSMIAIHLVWLDQSEIKLLGEKQAALAYCPSSNMFLSDGISNIPDLVDAGVRVTLGSDGACSNNRISVFEEMRMCSLLQKVSKLDGTCITAKQVFDMGTKTGAELLQLNTGELKVGKQADFVSLDLNDMSLSPKQELFANVVYSLQPTAIKDVVVNGKTIVEAGELKTVSEKKIIQKVDSLFEKWHAAKA
ncbi:5-methylthioadenosine/S-adenosylhomocysteine deaminase [Alkalihalobacillus xiaoxiensis]|uniref:5-methylthioadenosine/S-adenosylhomocysteine deaminase n=1 Tax=Shouchella xiaoxiensis TaxID=766895 RepID=A0ABS2SPY2_9BACI|nr:amidohydrolase [Shouchella xiaoxiensis]MBM7836865.1 5-methylthioadenosine/S-adenosylhomocysteine deaminase [Shouchella xiaoxiensis]